jgi:hypothetical protein
MPRYSILPARAQDESYGLSHADISVLVAIGTYTSTDGGRCWANAKTLCKRAHVSRNQFFLSAKRLIAAGLVARESGQAKGESSHYSIIFDQEAVPITGTGGVPITGTGAVSGVTESGTPAPRRPVRDRRTHRYATTMNDPSNKPANKPRALGELINSDEQLRKVASGR